MDDMSEYESKIYTRSIPLSRRIFSIFLLAAFISLSIFALLAFGGEYTRQQEHQHYRNAQWLSLGARHVNSVMSTVYKNALKMADADSLRGDTPLEAEAYLKKEAAAWPGVYLEELTAQGDALATANGGSALADKLHGLDKRLKINAVHRALQNQQFVDIVSVDGSIFIQALYPVSEPDRAPNKKEPQKFILIYTEIDKTFVRGLQQLVGVDFGILPADVSDPAHIVYSGKSDVATSGKIKAVENTNEFPAHRAENISGNNSLVSYAPVRNQAGKILAYLFVVDSSQKPPFSTLSTLALFAAFAYFCLLLLLGLYASRHVRVAIGGVRAALENALNGKIPEEGLLNFLSPLGEVSEILQKLLITSRDNKNALDYSVKEKNSVLLDFREYQEAVAGLSTEKINAEKAYNELFETSPQGLFKMDDYWRLTAVNQSLAKMLGYNSPAQCLAEASSFGDQICFSPEEWAGIQHALMENTEIAREVNLSRRDHNVLFTALRIKRTILPGGARNIVYNGMVIDLSLEMHLREAENQRKAAAAASSYKTQFLARMSHEIRTPLNAIIGMSEMLEETNTTEEQREYVDILKNAGNNLLGIINDILDFSKVESGKMTLEKVPVDIAELITTVGQQFELAARNKGLEFEVNIAQNLPPRVACDPLRLRQILGNMLSNALKFTDKGKVSLSVYPHPDAPREVGATTLIFSVSDTGVGVPKNKQNAIFEDFIQADDSVTRRFGGTGLGLSISKILTEMMGGKITLASEENKGTIIYVTIRFEHLPFLTDEVSTTEQIVTAHGVEQPIYMAESHFGVQPMTSESSIMPEKVAPELTEPEYVTSENYHRTYHSAQESAFAEQASYQPSANAPDTTREFERRAHDQHQNFPDLNSSNSNSLAGLVGGRTEAEAQDEMQDEGRQLKILHVEDNPNNRQIFSLYLRGTPHFLMEAHNGQEAVEAFHQHKFDVIFMDIEMPLMDGCQATRILRAMEAEQGLHHTPILAITAHVLPEARQQMFAAGCDEFIAKPYKKANILEMINKYGYGKA